MIVVSREPIICKGCFGYLHRAGYRDLTRGCERLPAGDDLREAADGWTRKAAGRSGHTPLSGREAES